MKTLITGGAGFIGSSVASACLDSGITPVILDDLSSGEKSFVSGREFYQGDVADGPLLDKIFSEHPDISSVVHCAAVISVPESADRPLDYYRNNVGKLIELVDHLLRIGCRRFLFSSSAAVYRPDASLVVTECSSTDPQSPYAQTKLMSEQILADSARAHGMQALALRYFNPIGADPLLRTGPQRPDPTHVLGRLIHAYDTATPFTINGVSWPTRDGSAIRDYVHVWDLARAHVLALGRFDDMLPASGGCEVINLGTGRGTSVSELVAAFQAIVGSIRVIAGPPRPGDVAGCHTSIRKARRLLGWEPEKSLEDGLRDALAWASRHRRLAVGAPA